MNENKIVIIICSHLKKIREEITKYIDKLRVPEGFELELIVIEDAKSMAEGYNRAMKRSDAKYKVYMHHDVFLINPLLLEKSIPMFRENSRLGMIGIIGCKKLPQNGVWWESESCIGMTIEDNLVCLKELNLGDVEYDLEEVQALDGQFLMTQYDIEWREDICEGWHFYDTSQCLEFKKAGYAIAVVKQDEPWAIHECGMDINTGYEVVQERFLREYKLQIENRDYDIEEKIGQLINIGEFRKAKEILMEYKKSAIYNDNMAIFESSILFEEGADEEAFLCIGKGLSYNSKNYELYFMLGNYYRNINKNQAYLCYENAEFYCHTEDKEFIASVKDDFYDIEKVDVKPVSIVVLSYNNLELTRLCMESICDTMPKSAGEIIIIDNASTDGSAEWLKGLQKSWEKISVTKSTPRIKIECNQMNKGFPGGCNQGILLAESVNDIFLLNNDTIIPPNAIFYLRMGLYENDKIGATGSISNHANNDQMVRDKKGSLEAWYQYGEKHNVPMKYPYEKKAWLMGFAIMFKRQVLEKVGYLDERFSPGNYEDNDIGYRILKEGYVQLLCKNSFIYHFGSIGFRKNQKAFDELLSNNRKKLADKYGFEIDRYSWVRTDLLDLIQEDSSAKLNILEIDCGLGSTIAKAESLYPNSQVVGIEKEQKATEFGINLACIFNGNITTMELPFEQQNFDYILFGNATEYLNDFNYVIKRLVEMLKSSGSIILSFSKVIHSQGKSTLVTKENLEKLITKCQGVFFEWIDKESEIDHYLRLFL